MTALTFTTLVLVYWFPVTGCPQDDRTPASIEQIVVTGSRNINRSTIIAMSGLKTGEPITRKRLAAAAQRMRATGLFGWGLQTGVRITAEILDEKARVVIEVVENDVVKGFEIRVC